MEHELFNDLFVLELANNHLGSIERGLKIISAFSQVVRQYQVRAAIKLQFRDVKNFIHPDFYHNTQLRYIHKTRTTQLTVEEYAQLVEAIKAAGCIPMSTPFDETAVKWCKQLNLPLIKIASSGLQDWSLIKAVATLNKPTIVSTGGSELRDIDNIVQFFAEQHIPLAINHCVSIYPSEDHELQLNQIDFLKNRYPANVIGFSTHEYHDWQASIFIAYAKGARTFERHIDIADDITVSPYCSQPQQIAEWFSAYHLAKKMCGQSGREKLLSPPKEIAYLDSLARGVYAQCDLPAGFHLTMEALGQTLFAAIPLLPGQLSTRELSDQPLVLASPIKANAPILLEHLQGFRLCSRQ